MNHTSRPKAGLKRKTDLFIGVAVTVLTLYAASYPFLYPPKLPSGVVDDTPLEIPDFSAITSVEKKKKAFFAYLIPEIERQNDQVKQERLFVLSVAEKLDRNKSLSDSSLRQLESLIENYRVKGTKTLDESVKVLLTRVDVIPVELVLAQAANESAWGTSRFAQQGYNFFGLWCFKKGCGFVPSRRTEGSAHEVAKFRNLSHAVMTYIRNLNRHYAYEELRDIRQTLRDNHQPVTAEALAQGLMSYSERGQDYIDELLSMISYNRKYMSL